MCGFHGCNNYVKLNLIISIIIIFLRKIELKKRNYVLDIRACFSLRRCALAGD